MTGAISQTDRCHGDLGCGGGAGAGERLAMVELGWIDDPWLGDKTSSFRTRAEKQQ